MRMLILSLKGICWKESESETPELEITGVIFR